MAHAIGLNGSGLRLLPNAARKNPRGYNALPESSKHCAANRMTHIAAKTLAADTELFDDRLVTRRFDALDVVEKLTTLGNELQQSAP